MTGEIPVEAEFHTSAVGWSCSSRYYSGCLHSFLDFTGGLVRHARRPCALEDAEAEHLAVVRKAEQDLEDGKLGPWLEIR